MSNNKNSKRIRRMVYAAICLALALVLPFLTGQVPQIGKMLCPMHIPTLLCGFICGPIWGALIGFIAPLLRYLLFGMPMLMPTGLSMAFELCAYGVITGIVYKRFPKKVGYIYLTLVIAMIIGRIVAGISTYIIMTSGGNAYTMATFLSVNFAMAVPGIIVQIILIPVIVMALEKSKLI